MRIGLRRFDLALLFILQVPLMPVMPLASDAAGGLSITSWNIANLHHVAGYAYRGEIGTWRTLGDIALIKKILERQSPDLILLQEASGELAVRDVVGGAYKILSTQEYNDRRDSDRPTQRDVYPFIAIRRELEANVILYLSVGMPSSVTPSETRDIQYIRLQVGSRRLGIIHVHTKSSCPTTVKHDSKNRSCQLIYAQFLAIGNLIKNHCRGDDEVLVIGDFNRELLNPALAEWRKHYAAWIVDVIGTAQCELRPSTQPIDFAIVTRRPASATLTLLNSVPDFLAALRHPLRISDHCPLAFRVNFNE